MMQDHCFVCVPEVNVIAQSTVAACRQSTTENSALIPGLAEADVWTLYVLNWSIVCVLQEVVPLVMLVLFPLVLRYKSTWCLTIGCTGWKAFWGFGALDRRGCVVGPGNEYGRLIIEKRWMNDVYLRRKRQFWRKTRLDPSTRMTYWSNFRISMTCLVQYCRKRYVLVLYAYVIANNQLLQVACVFGQAFSYQQVPFVHDFSLTVSVSRQVRCGSYFVLYYVFCRMNGDDVAIDRRYTSQEMDV